jgi:hypothetical protein
VREEDQGIVCREPGEAISLTLHFAPACAMELGNLLVGERLGARVDGEEVLELLSHFPGNRFVILTGQGQEQDKVGSPRVEAIEPEAPD